MTIGEVMKRRVAATILAVVSVTTLSACGSDLRTTGTVQHAGYIGVKGSTAFTLAGSDESYNCYTSYDDDCSMIKEGNKVSFEYHVFPSGDRSVSTLNFIDDNTTAPVS
jgi:hypothetical protein